MTHLSKTATLVNKEYAADCFERHTCNEPGTHEATLSLLGLEVPAIILDLGCYEGLMSSALLAQGHTVMSCDIVAYKGTETLPCFQIVDANQSLPYPNMAFDAIICTEVIEHLENPTSLIRECSRMLKTNGILILSTPNVSSFLSRMIYGITGEFPFFREYHYREWGHISPISNAWVEFTAMKFNLRIEAVCSEKRIVGWKRRLAYSTLSPIFYPFLRRQTGALLPGKTSIICLRKLS